MDKDPKVGHDYMPNWISVPFFVDEIKNGRVYGQFYTGHKRDFALKGFMDSFTHYEDCISSDHIKALPNS